MGRWEGAQPARAATRPALLLAVLQTVHHGSPPRQRVPRAASRLPRLPHVFASHHPFPYSSPAARASATAAGPPTASSLARRRLAAPSADARAVRSAATMRCTVRDRLGRASGWNVGAWKGASRKEVAARLAQTLDPTPNPAPTRASAR